MGSKNTSYNFQELDEQSQTYKQKFDQLYIFGKMDYESRKGCKIGNNGGMIYIYSNNTFQSLQRWWYRESREDFLNYLSAEFTDYIHFLSKIQELHKQVPYQSDLKKLWEENINFIGCIFPGLDKCKYIYNDFKMLDYKIDNIMSSLKQFVDYNSGKHIQFMNQSISQILPQKKVNLPPNRRST
jgi:hypothetical protein